MITLVQTDITGQSGDRRQIEACQAAQHLSGLKMATAVPRLWMEGAPCRPNAWMREGV